MKLPHPLLDSLFFIFASESEFLRALSDEVSDDELSQIKELTAAGLPPITSRSALATMFGINPGLIQSFLARPGKHYREFSIPKGRGERRIQAPKVALKIVQKWLSVQLGRAFTPPDHVFGFVLGRSHVLAAVEHAESSWVFSVDIRNFFESTPLPLVQTSLAALGYERHSAELIASLCCYRGYLAQGAPTSPVLSNICFADMDAKLAAPPQGSSATRLRN